MSESFVDTTASLTLGVYHSFSDLPGDEPNDLFDPGTAPDIVAHPALKTDAQLQPGGALDARYLAKTRDIASQTQLGFTTDIAFTLYPQLSSPIPIIRNEELILIRSEANFRAGNQADAFTDLNTIRVNSGGLAAAVLDANNYEDELLYNRRYSLMFEGGHRWIDTRRLGRITDLPLDTPGSRRNEAFPIPEAECLARSLTSTLGGPCI